MLTFLRKIRLKSLRQSRFSNYLLYAVGEIVLVVIGILVALQLNAMKDARKDADTEKIYLQGIANDLNQDIFELTGLIEFDTTQFDTYTLILRAFENDTLDVYSKVFLTAIRDAQYIRSFSQNNIVFEDMKSSGKINVIKIDYLRFMLLEYFKESSTVEMLDQQTYKHIMAFSDDAFLDNADLNSLVEQFLFPSKWSAELDDLDLSFFERRTDDPEVQRFANRISSMKASTLVMYFRHVRLLQQAQKLRSKIATYLEDGTVETGDAISKELLRAFEKDNIDDVIKRLNLDAINNCFDLGGGTTYSYLAWVIKVDAKQSFDYLLANGSDVNLVCRNKSPLMYATKYGRLEMAKVLLEKGADFKVVVEGETALSYARAFEHEDLVQLLLENGATE